MNHIELSSTDLILQQKVDLIIKMVISISDDAEEMALIGDHVSAASNILARGSNDIAVWGQEYIDRLSSIAEEECELYGLRYPEGIGK